MLVIDTKLSALLAKAVPDDRLSDEGLPASIFKDREIEFYIADNGLERCRIQVVEEEGARNPARIVVARAPVKDGEIGDYSARVPLGIGHDKFKSSIYFSYAVEYDGLEPKWEQNVEGTPRVIRYTISVKHPTKAELQHIATSARRMPNI
jgi:hypothetical protein